MLPLISRQCWRPLHTAPAVIGTASDPPLLLLLITRRSSAAVSNTLSQQSAGASLSYKPRPRLCFFCSLSRNKLDKRARRRLSAARKPWLVRQFWTSFSIAQPIYCSTIWDSGLFRDVASENKGRGGWADEKNSSFVQEVVFICPILENMKISSIVLLYVRERMLGSYNFKTHQIHRWPFLSWELNRILRPFFFTTYLL